MLLYDSFSCGFWNDVASANPPVNKANEKRVKQIIPSLKEILYYTKMKLLIRSWWIYYCFWIDKWKWGFIGNSHARHIYLWIYFYEIYVTQNAPRVKQLLFLVKSWKNENVINELNDETFVSLENCLAIIIHLNYHGKGILREEETFLRDFSKLSYQRNMNH